MLRQFSRRGLPALNLPTHAPREDWLAICAGMGLKEPKDYADLLASTIVKEDGLGKLCKFLRKGQQMAAQKKERFTWDHFTRGYDLFGKLCLPVPVDDEKF